MVKTGFGHDSHRFEDTGSEKPLILGGVRIQGCRGLAANSDGDVVLHALSNAISGVTGNPVLGAVADKVCLEQGVCDSSVYVGLALQSLHPDFIITHVSISVEAAKPRLSPYHEEIKHRIASLLNIGVDSVGLTATSGENLTAFGRGEGIQAFAVVSAVHRSLIAESPAR